MTAAETCAALSADGVNLIYKDYSRCAALCGLEQIADTPCADADIELEEFGCADREEGNMRFACNSLCKQRLTCARRADKEHALGDSCAHLGKCLGRAQEINNLAQLLLFLIRTGNIGKGDLVAELVGSARMALGEAHALLVLALVKQNDDKHKAADKQNVRQYRQQEGGGGLRIEPAIKAVIENGHGIPVNLGIMLGDKAGHLVHEYIGRFDGDREIIGLTLIECGELSFGTVFGKKAVERFLRNLYGFDIGILTADFIAHAFFNDFEEFRIIVRYGIPVYIGISGRNEKDDRCQNNHPEQYAPVIELLILQKRILL